MLATEIGLPLGNEWEFSERNLNVGLQPGRGVRARTQQGVLGDVVGYIQDRYLADGWGYTAIVQNLPGVKEINVHHLITVFTHPSRTDLLATWKPDLDEFLKHRAFAGSDYTSESIFYIVKEHDSINKILKGTNFFIDLIQAGYQSVKVGEKYMWQTGVVAFDMSLRRLEDRVSGVDAQLEEQMRRVGLLRERKAALELLHSPNPMPLFQRR